MSNSLQTICNKSLYYKLTSGLITWESEEYRQYLRAGVDPLDPGYFFVHPKCGKTPCPVCNQLTETRPPSLLYITVIPLAQQYCDNWSPEFEETLEQLPRNILPLIKYYADLMLEFTK